MTLGNHEFDDSIAGLTPFLKVGNKGTVVVILSDPQEGLEDSQRYPLNLNLIKMSKIALFFYLGKCSILTNPSIVPVFRYPKDFKNSQFFKEKSWISHLFLIKACKVSGVNRTCYSVNGIRSPNL